MPPLRDHDSGLELESALNRIDRIRARRMVAPLAPAATPLWFCAWRGGREPRSRHK